MKKAFLLAIIATALLGTGTAAASLSGSWVTNAKLVLQPFSLSSFTSTLTVDYTLGTWTFRSLTQIDLTGWSSQIFSSNGTIGGVTASSHLAFDPKNAAFSYWNTSTTLTIAGVSFTGTSTLTPVGMGWTLGAQASVDNVSFSAKAYFNEDSNGVIQTDSYTLCFSSVNFDIQFPFGCIDPLDITVGFSAANGFDGLTVNLNNIVWEQFPAITFDVKIEFTLQTEGKTLTITPKLNLEPGCVTLYGEIMTGTSMLEITGINIYGLSLEYSWNGTSFASYSSFDPDKNSIVIGKSDYWEKFVIKNTNDSCCGGVLQFEVSTYFQSGSIALFDWGETDLALSIGVGSNITLKTGTVFTAQNGFEEWALGLELDW